MDNGSPACPSLLALSTAPAPTLLPPAAAAVVAVAAAAAVGCFGAMPEPDEGKAPPIAGAAQHGMAQQSTVDVMLLVVMMGEHMEASGFHLSVHPGGTRDYP